MQINFDYTALPIHKPFHESRAQERALFGAFGSGKTYGLCAEAIAVALEQMGSRILITRKTIPELRDTTETVFFDILPTALRDAGEIRRIGGHVERFTFPNGSVVLFRSIDDWVKMKSLNVAWIFWDEADEFDLETYRGMSTRVRQRDPTSEAKALGAPPLSITRRGMCLATNPAGHNWIYKRFIPPETRSPNTAYFKSTSFDNAFLPAEYLEMLMDAPEDWVRRYVLCQFDDFAGQIYADWNHADHFIEPPKIEVPQSEVFWMGMDPGTRSPTAGLWAWLDKENRRLVGIAEYQQNYMSAKQHADTWRTIEAQHRMKPKWRVADPNVMTHDRGTNMTLHDQYSRLGYNFNLGPRTHKVRIPMLGQMIYMRKFVLTKNCPMAFEQIAGYKWEDLSSAMRARGTDAPDKPLKKNEHLVDCAQYLSSRWVGPVKEKGEVKPQDFSAQVHSAINKQLARKRRRTQSHSLGGVRV